MGTRGEVFSSTADTPKRTYFFTVKENRLGDVFLNIVESKKNGEDQFERRSVIVFKEDLAAFLEAMEAAEPAMPQRTQTTRCRKTPELSTLALPIVVAAAHVEATCQGRLQACA